MRTIRDIFGCDLLHLALILNLLSADVSRNNFANRFRNLDSYDENLIRHKAVLDDLHDLGSSGRWFYHQQPSDPVEISAYVLNSLQEEDGQQPSSGGQVGQNGAEDGDSGVSDVDSGSSTGSVGGRSPSMSSETSNTNYEFNEDEGRVVSDGNLDFLDDLALPESLHTEDPFFAMDPVDLVGAIDPVPEFQPPEDVDMRQLLDFDEPCTNRDINLASFAPDEEDVENQLMHIDDQLIRLDGSIDNINEGVDSLNGAIVAANEDEMALDEDDSMMEALLGRDDQDYLFSALQESSTDLSPFESWQVDANRDLDDLINVGNGDIKVEPKKTPDIKEEPDIKKEPEIKIEPKEETDSEPEKIVIKQEIIDDEEDFYVDGATAATQPYHESEDNKLGIINKFEDFQLHLADHNYAASPFEEGQFERSFKIEEEYYENGAYSPTSSYYLSSAYLSGASASPTPSSTSSSASRFRLSRDEKKARMHGLPFTCSELIDCSMDKFNDLISTSGLTESQMALCRDIRRRGKNKVAAQNCRRRKIDLISNLSEEIIRAREYKQQLMAEREHLFRMRNEWTNRLLHLEEQVLRGLDKNSDDYALELMPNSQQIRVTQRRSRGPRDSTAARLAKPARA